MSTGDIIQEDLKNRKQLVLNRASAGNIAHWVITFDPSLVLCQILERTFIWTPMQLHVEKNTLCTSLDYYRTNWPRDG